MSMATMSISLTTDRAQAIFNHCFVSQKRSLEGAPGPGVEITFLADADAHLPIHQRSKWAVGGNWGPIGYGNRWPDRLCVRDLKP